MSLSSSSLNWKVRRELQLQRQQWWAELSNAPTSIILSIHLVILPSIKLLRLEWSSRPWKHSGTHFPNPLVLEVTKSLGWNGIDCCFSKWKVKVFHVYVYVVFGIWFQMGNVIRGSTLSVPTKIVCQSTTGDNRSVWYIDMPIYWHFWKFQTILILIKILNREFF